MTSTSFYIHDGRKQRRLSLRDGFIEGWGRGTFVYVTNKVQNKLVAVKTSAVRNALRKLECGERSALRSGPRLPYKRSILSQQKRREHYISGSVNRYSRRSSFSSSDSFRNHSKLIKSVHKVDTAVNAVNKGLHNEHSAIQITNENVHKIVQKVDTGVQTTANAINKVLHNKHRAVQIIDENVPKAVQKVDTGIQTTVSAINIDNELATIQIPDENVPPSVSKETPKKLSPIKLKKQWSFAGSDEASSKRKLTRIKLKKKDSKNLNLYKRKTCKSIDPPAYVVLPKKITDNKEIMYNGNEYVKTKEICRESDSSESSRESQPQVKKKTKSRGNIESERQTSVEKNDEVSTSQAQPKSSLEKAYMESPTCQRELVIDDDVIILLRDYLMSNASDFDLLKFDEDLTYKMQFLYAVNPVVKIERCPKIQQMIRRDSVSEISLKDFASQLGLESVSEKNTPRRYRMRIRNNDLNSNSDKDTENMNNYVSREDTETSRDSDSDFAKEKRASVRKSDRVQRKKVLTRRNTENDVSSRKRHWSDIDTDSDPEDQTSSVARASIKSKATPSVVELKNIVRRKVDQIFSKVKNPKPKEVKSDRDTSPKNVKGKAEKENNIDQTKSDTEESDSDGMPERKQQKENQNKSKEKHTDQNVTSSDKKSINKTAKNGKINTEKQINSLVTNVKIHVSSKNFSKSDIAKPSICEVKSLAVEANNKERPPSIASSLVRQEYSNFEDHTIVAWLRMGGRARRVNGNQIWKELEKEYFQITKQHRSWHSLRNRYLRSILPRLGQLALDPGLVSRLRSAAHTGELKARRAEVRRNSIYGAPPVPGALSRRLRSRRSPTADGEPPGTKPKPDHTSQPYSSQKDPSSSSSEDRSRSPRFSQLIRRYVDKPRDSSPKVSPPRKIPTRNSIKTQIDEKKTPETRNSTRNTSPTKNNSTKLSETKNSSKKTLSSSKSRGKKIRKLFNPNSLI